MASLIDTPPKRAKLKARKNPYWHGISGGRGGVSLGYRKGAGPGAWVGKLVFEGKRIEEKLATADDDEAPTGAVPFRSAVTMAMDWARQKVAEVEDRKPGDTAPKAPTVETAIAEYVIQRKAKSAEDGANAAGRLKKHVLANTEFCRTPLAKLREHHFESWRAGLPLRGIAGEERPDEDLIAPSTFNRLASDLRAALNRAAEKYRRQLPAQILPEIRVGTRSLQLEETARKQILSDRQVADLVRVAQDVAIDPDGDFGRLVAVLAATGARFSQVAALDVVDLQIEVQRLMIGGAKKGRRATAKPPVAYPLSNSVVDLLRPLVENRGPSEPLLERWTYKRGEGLKWLRDKRARWEKSKQAQAYWNAALTMAGLPPDTIPYALRHSSIVRGLRAGIPIRIVASLHDTSVQMIERHYGRYISEATEDIARRGSLSL